MKAIMLVLTEKCNLACKYCYERRDAYEMTFENAKAVIDREMRLQGDQDFKIFFFGGEPFVRFDVLKRIYQYTEEQYAGRVVKYAVTTNGTLVHGAVRDWLYEQRDRFEITLSLDGTEEMHNRGRVFASGEGSYEKIDLKFFTETWTGCIAKMTISPHTLKDFAKGVISLEQLGFHCKANFASGVDFRLDENRQTLLQNFTSLIEYYSGNDHPLCYMLDLPLTAVLVPLDEKFRYCQAGTDRHCYADEKDGWYPCQGLMPMSLQGQEKKFRHESFQEGCVWKNSKCGNCKFVRICRTCYAMNYNATNNVYEPDRQICMLNQACMITSARIQYNRMKKSGISDKRLERAIFVIASELNGILSVC